MSKYKPGDVIQKINDEPFPDSKTAAMQQGLWEKRGVETEVIEVDGGWALKVAGDEEVSAKKRPKRAKLGFRNVMTAPKELGYVRRYVNDSGGRVAMFEDAGWEIVIDPKLKVGDEYVGNTRLPGGAVVKPVGGGVNAVLMQKRKEWFDEDYAEKQAEIDAAEKGLVRKAQLDNLHVAPGYTNGIDIDRRMGN